jgi:hypothetical protein
MRLVKTLLFSMAISGIGFTASTAQAGTFNSAISNPFIFCSLPKPCKYCQPFRQIHETICPAGQPSAQAKQQYQDAINANPALASTALTPEQFKSQLTPAIQSAYDDSVSLAELDKYISWLGRQPAPASTGLAAGNLMIDYWYMQGISDPVNNPTIRNTATDVIQKINQAIVASVSAGNIPSNPKPWFDNYSSPTISSSPTIGTSATIHTSPTISTSKGSTPNYYNLK